jgi:hypothetical protein
VTALVEIVADRSQARFDVHTLLTYNSSAYCIILRILLKERGISLSDISGDLNMSDYLGLRAIMALPDDYLLPRDASKTIRLISRIKYTKRLSGTFSTPRFLSLIIKLN